MALSSAGGDTLLCLLCRSHHHCDKDCINTAFYFENAPAGDGEDMDLDCTACNSGSQPPRSNSHTNSRTQPHHSGSHTASCCQDRQRDHPHSHHPYMAALLSYKDTPHSEASPDCSSPAT